jgi:hypothetical protein
MRDQIVANLRELLSKLDDYEQERFSQEPDVINDYLLEAHDDTVTPFDAQAIAAFIGCIGKDLNDSELSSLCNTIDARAEQILQLEEEIEEACDAEKIRSYWEEKEYLSASDIGIQLEISHSGAKVNKVLQSLGLQERMSRGWVATDKAEGLAFQRGLEEGEKPYIRWDKSIIQYLTAALQ